MIEWIAWPHSFYAVMYVSIKCISLCMTKPCTVLIQKCHVSSGYLFASIADAFLFTEVSATDADTLKWLTLELYALMRIGAPNDVIDRVVAELKTCSVTEERLVDVLAVLKLRLALLAFTLDVVKHYMPPRDV